MPRDNETITGWKVYSRLARVLTRKGTLKALIASRRLDPESVDSFGKEIQRAAERWPEGIAIKFEDRELTFAEVNAASNRYAHALKSLGVGKGDVVAVDVENRPEFLLALSGVYKLGAIGALINTSLRSTALEHCLSLVAPRVVVVGEEQLDAVASLEDRTGISPTWAYLADTGAEACPADFTDLDALAAAASAENLPETDDIKLGDPATYVYTSGTTGLPKASINDHRRLRYGGILVGGLVVRCGPGDTTYTTLPFYHVTSLMGGYSGAIHTGAAVAIGRKFSASTYWDEVRRYDATAMIYIGEMLRYLHNQPPTARDRDHRVRLMYGAGLRHEIWNDFKERFGIEQVREVYGASESPSAFLNLLNFDKTCGWSPTGWKTVAYDVDLDAPVRGDDGLLVEVGPGEVGLLVFEINDAQPYNGYTDKEASAKKVLADVFKPGDSWFHTGDLVLNQGHGHVRFIDRIGDTFRWRGENVATTEIERVLNGWHQVEDAVAYGVEVPGAEGRCGMAWVQVRDGEELDLDGVAKTLRAELPGFAVPRFLVTATGSASVTGTFKHQKSDLKKAGYALAAHDGPVHLLTPDAAGFVALTPESEAALAAGGVRL
ncbi:long-chain-acyl-CoA synthetase [Nocardioides marmoriginsengisoli]|uniref:Long-chain-acyl-CoA synthetase n=1 Tax=Nocardioides marmoriginsengisoli TaxID=661483 RepID=A0A3N0CC94_9ACTN|nr:long-chain-acyl-CoA synthetase [Nocardioides marmoriginsengisoli]RNL61075.1 long-chain-acyl-CoA synthetase [Nocardioides marmoriginsengisoli]